MREFFSSSGVALFVHVFFLFSDYGMGRRYSNHVLQPFSSEKRMSAVSYHILRNHHMKQQPSIKHTASQCPSLHHRPPSTAIAIQNIATIFSRPQTSRTARRAGSTSNTTRLTWATGREQTEGGHTYHRVACVGEGAVPGNGGPINLAARSDRAGSPSTGCKGPAEVTLTATATQTNNDNGSAAGAPRRSRQPNAMPAMLG